MTAKDVADRLNVSVRTVRRWALNDDIPSVRLPSGTLRFDPAAIDSLVGGAA